jgi:hypothetical protein
VRLRGFRKSHQLIPTSPERGLQLAATRQSSAPACCVRINHRI